MNKFFYISMPDNRRDIVEFLFWVVVAYGLFTWLSVHSQTAITADTLWLCDAAGRLLSGHKMSESFYDPNPPLSVILYLPPALIAKLGWMTTYSAAFYYTLLLVLIFTFLTFRLLKAAPDIDATANMTITGALLISATVLSSLSFTERDQILGAALVPFVLAQIAVTRKWPVSRMVLHLALLLGAILILLKPHHGLIPTLILLHRLVTQKRLDVCKDPDFLYLAGAVIAYISVLFLFFHDYLSVIFPDVLSLYLREPSSRVLIKAGAYGMIGIAAILIAIVFNNKNKLVMFLLLSSLISMIPFIVQMRGYHYHLMPAAIFFWCGSALLTKETLEKFMAPHYALLLTTAFMTVFSFMLTPTRVYFPTHQSYDTMPMTELLKEKCPKPCSFFVLNDHIEITHQTALYGGYSWASRFPSFWFLTGLHNNPTLSPEIFAEKQQKYAALVTEDLAKYQPQIILLGEFKLAEEKFFDFVSFFSVSDSFRKEWSRYKRQDDFTMDQRVYFTGTNLAKPRPMTYQVYIRRE